MLNFLSFFAEKANSLHLHIFWKELSIVWRKTPCWPTRVFQ